MLWVRRIGAKCGLKFGLMLVCSIYLYLGHAPEEEPYAAVQVELNTQQTSSTHHVSNIPGPQWPVASTLDNTYAEEFSSVEVLLSSSL